MENRKLKRIYIRERGIFFFVFLGENAKPKHLYCLSPQVVEWSLRVVEKRGNGITVLHNVFLYRDFHNAFRFHPAFCKMTIHAI